MTRPRPTRARRRRAWLTPRYVMATLTSTDDRDGTGRTDDGRTLPVKIPNGLWCVPGDRVALFRYPDGWVAVARQVTYPSLAFR